MTWTLTVVGWILGTWIGYAAAMCRVRRERQGEQMKTLRGVIRPRQSEATRVEKKMGAW